MCGIVIDQFWWTASANLSDQMDEIAEGTVGTLHILASKAHSRSSICAMKSMPLFVPVRLLVHL